MAAIEVQDLAKWYGDLIAVDGVSFTVGEGEIFGFLGPNGAGKTTTISMLCTLVKPTSGRAAVAGHDVARGPHAVRRAIGLVFQEPSVDDRLTAWENLLLHAVLYDVPGQERARRMGQALDLVELSERRDHLVKTFSGGMKRRLEIARSLVHRPRVLFLDEPTVGLDPQTSLAMTVLFTSLFTGTSIVWDREFGFLKELLVAPVSDTVAILGKILGGSSVATVQGTLLLAFAPLAGVPLSVGAIVRLWALMLVIGFALTTLGVAIAVRMRSLEGFQVLMNFLNVPMLFLSGAFFPLRELPVWLAVLVRANPFTYAVDALRQVALQALEFSPGMPQAPIGGRLGITLFEYTLSLGDDVLLIIVFGVAMAALASQGWRSSP